MKFALSATFVLLFLCWLIGFMMGWSLGPPQPIAQADIALPTLPAATYIPAITITDIEAKRQQVIDYLFGGALPGTFPTRNGEFLTVTLPHEFRSVGRIVTPAQPNGAIIIYHAGHDGTTTGQYAQVADQFTQAGYMVVLMDMPLYGLNTGAVVADIPGAGTMPITSHDHIAHLSDALRVFIEPVIVVVNWAQAQGYERIYMVGLSGGGWTTTLAAAVDTRIDASYPVAGSVPLGLRFDTTANWGDWEQVIPEFYQEVATYEDLYILGSYERRQMQILNSADSCCFAEPRYGMYERAVRAFLAGRGAFSVVMVASGEHSINEAALRAILEDMEP